MKFNFQKNGEHFDRRSHCRIGVSLPVLVTLEDGTAIPALVNNLSVTGLTVLASEQLREHAQDELTFLIKLNDQTGFHHLFFRGEIVRSEPLTGSTQYQYAVGYTDITASTVSLIDSFICSRLNKEEKKDLMEAMR